MQRKRVVAYCRVSTLEQKKRGYGLDIQIRDVTLCAQAHGLFIERFFKDEESGVEEHRRGLKRLLRACKAGKIGTIIIPSLDRLSRDVRLAENLFYDFEKLGVKILIADMPNYDGKNRKDVLIRQIREAIAEENRKEIIERLFKGRQERVRKGRPPGGNTPYGYVRRNKALIVDPKEAEVVKRIYALGSDSQSGQAIAEVLNREGYRRRSGKPWTQRQVWAILSREALYCKGIFTYGEVVGKNKSLILVEE